MCFAGEGKEEPTGDCYGGYYCKSGAKQPDPPYGTNKRCTAGYYCPNGTKVEIDCPGWCFGYWFIYGYWLFMVRG